MSKHRTHSEIIGEIRLKCARAYWSEDSLHPNGDIPGIKCLEPHKLATLLESAHKRELDELKKQLGNVAKLREAVKAVVDVGYPHNFQKEAPHIRGYCYDITKAVEKCFAALAAPPRNCDILTPEECLGRFLKFCGRHYCNRNCPYINCKDANECMFAFAQSPYESEVTK